MTLAFNLGGTIALSYVEGDPVMVAGSRILGATHLPIRELNPVQSHWMGWSHLLLVRDELLAAHATGERSFLILTGTDSAEDLLYFLDLVRPADTRVLVMVSMRTASIDDPRPDGLDQAMAWLETSGSGIGLCWGPGIIEGPLAEKIWNERWQFGPVDWAEKTPDWRVAPDVAIREEMPIVPILSVGIGSADWQAGVLSRGGFDGLVVEAYASGDTPPATATALMSLVSNGCPVVLASRSRPGRVKGGFPGIAGTSHGLLAHGLLGAAQLDPHRARLRLALALACKPRADLSAVFNGNQTGEKQ
ncbi:MAG: hypothetical protein WBA88_17200 [Pseudaminobacter sp.]